MGADFRSMRLDGKLTTIEATREFHAAQDQDRYENGHMYSGGFGMATGLIVDRPGHTFERETAAAAYLHDACQKWEEARMVSFLDENKVPTWLIGAWCAS
jgi:hypothetical protein